MPKVGVEEFRKEQVIEATRRCIVKNGVLKLSIKSIASEAGISTGIIYHYFKNKEELLLQVIRESFLKSHTQVMETVEPLRSPKEKLYRHIENINRVPHDNPEFYGVMLNYLGQVRSNPEIRRIIIKFFNNLKSYVGQYLGEGIQSGDFSPEKASHLPEMVIALGMGLGIMWTVDPDAFDIEKIGESYKELIARYLVEPDLK